MHNRIHVHTLRALGMSSFSSEMIPRRTPLVSSISFSPLFDNEHFGGNVDTDLGLSRACSFSIVLSVNKRAIHDHMKDHMKEVRNLLITGSPHACTLTFSSYVINTNNYWSTVFIEHNTSRMKTAWVLGAAYHVRGGCRH